MSVALHPTRPPTAADNRDATRAASAPPGRLPDFLIIGAAKAGTTTLYRRLQRHPQVFMPDDKEPEFFLDRWDRGIEWYRGLFADAERDRVCGEASTNYSCGTFHTSMETAARRMADLLGEVKLIYIMRHPVDRAYAFYREQIKTAQLIGQRVEYGETFEQYLQRDPRCVAGSRYIDVLELYERHFGKAAILPLLLDDLKTDPAATMSRVFSHLGVDPEAAPTADVPVVTNRMADHQANFVREKLVEPLRRLPLLGPLGSRLPEPVRHAIYAVLRAMPGSDRKAASMTPPPMQDETRRRLRRQLAEPTDRLAGRLGRDLSAWM